MSIAYGLRFKGSVDYVIITNGNRKVIYDIGELSTGACRNQEDRQEELMKIVSANEPIPHTHVIKIALDLCSIAKRTIEKELNNLEQEGLLESEKDGESFSNGSRLWSIKSPEHEYEKHAKKEAKGIIFSLENYIKKIEKKFPSFNEVKKDYAMADLLDILHAWQPIMEIISKETRIKNEKKKFDSLVKQAYDILKKYDNRDFIDGRPFLRRLLHLKSSQPMVNMNEFLDESDGRKKSRIAP